MMKKFFIYTIMWVVVSGAIGINLRASMVRAEGMSDTSEEVGAGGDDAGGTGPGGLEEVVINEKIPEIYIKAVNPGYTVDGVSNVGEMIEIARNVQKTDPDTPILLAGLTIGYTNSSGNYSTLVEFPEHVWLVGESLLARLNSAPEAEEANLTYTKTLAMKAGLSLMRGEEVVDEVCWTSKEGCYKEFKSANPTVLVRNLETGEFEHKAVGEYEVKYAAENYKVEEPEEGSDEGRGGGDVGEVAVASQCRGVQFTEILSYYETLKAEQFVELYNSGAEQVLLKGCKLRYKNKNYELSGVLGAEGYVAVYPSVLGFGLTKNPTNANTLELIDTDGAVVDTLVYPNGQRKGTAYALIGYDGRGEEIWKVTYAPTPGAPNNYQEFKTCEAGKVINEATGNCVKVTTVTEKVCAAGQYLNPLTGRCKKYETVTEKTCKEGYYLNPETGRCRKIVENAGAEYGVEPEEYEEEASFVGLYAVLGVLAVGVLYLVYEFRREIWKLGRKAWQGVSRKMLRKK